MTRTSGARLFLISCGTLVWRVTSGQQLSTTKRHTSTCILSRIALIIQATSGEVNSTASARLKLRRNWKSLTALFEKSSPPKKAVRR